MARRPRQRIKAHLVEPERGARFYIMPEPAESCRKPKKRPFHTPNPFHEGIREAKASGTSLSKSRTLYPAVNGHPHFEDVACDWRTRKSEREQQKRNNRWNAFFEKLERDTA